MVESIPDVSQQQPVVVITGASAGVGRATARAFGARGAKVGLVARGRDGLEGAQRELERQNTRAVVLAVDVADGAAVEDAAEQVEQAFGPIDIWINCAMVTVFSPISEMRSEEFRRVMDVNYLGYVNGTLAALRRMRRRNQGTIVQVSSALAFRSIPLQSAYCASKAAVRAFTESLRTELIHDGSSIHVTMVHLPAVNTPQFGWARSHIPRKPQPVPPIFQPEVAAEAIVWAAQHRRRSLTVGGSTAQAILGQKFFPGLLDRFLASKGYDGQITDQPLDPDRPDNLHFAVAGDHGAHGDYDDRAKARSWQLEANLHRGALATAACLLAVAGMMTWTMRRRLRP